MLAIDANIVCLHDDDAAAEYQQTKTVNEDEIYFCTPRSKEKWGVQATVRHWTESTAAAAGVVPRGSPQRSRQSRSPLIYPSMLRPAAAARGLKALLQMGLPYAEWIDYLMAFHATLKHIRTTQPHRYRRALEPSAAT